MFPTSQQSDDTVPARDISALALAVELDSTDDSAIVRVLTLLVRRRCIVVRATFAPSPDLECNVLHIELEAPRHLRANLTAWVSALVPVRSVHVRSDPHGQTAPAPVKSYESAHKKPLAAPA